MGPATLRMLPKPSWRGALVAVACLSITHGQETPTDVPSAAPSVGVSSAPSLPANSPTLGPTYNETGDTDDYTDSPTPPPTVDDEVAPCNAVQCNSTRDCAECFPANTTRYAFCDVSDSSPTQSVCLECVACEYDTSLSASEGSCAQASVCNGECFTLVFRLVLLAILSIVLLHSDGGKTTTNGGFRFQQYSIIQRGHCDCHRCSNSHCSDRSCGCRDISFCQKDQVWLAVQ